MSDFRSRAAVASTLTLLTSSATLLCCALPAFMVALGAGAAFAGLVSAWPQITVLSEHKVALFAISGAALFAAGVLQWRGRNAPCPADPAQAAACQRLRKTSAATLSCSVAIYLVGGFFAFVAPLLL